MNALIVYKKSVYELYKDSPDKETRAYLEKEGLTEQEMLQSHEEQRCTLESITQDLQRLSIPHKEIYRADLHKEDLSPYNLLISVGGDGTLLELSHYIHLPDLPLLGVNSDPGRSTGFFCSANRENFRLQMQGIEQEKKTQVHRLQLIRNGIPLQEQVLNEVLFAHASPGAGSRFLLQVAKDNPSGENKEPVWVPAQRYRISDGITVCTAPGSTGSMYNYDGQVLCLDSEQMQYKVRGVRGQTSHLAREVKITSHSREGKLFVDGNHVVYELGLGSVLEVKQGIPLTIVGDLQEKQDAFVKKQKEWENQQQ